jgi:hypothetical protein
MLPLNTIVTPAHMYDKEFPEKANTNLYEIWWIEYINGEAYYIVTPGAFNMKTNNKNKILSTDVLRYDSENWARLEDSKFTTDNTHS